MDKPKIRFKGFEDAWEQRKLGEVTKELSEYDNLQSGLPLLTSARTGLMYQSDYRGNVTTDNENTLFSVVPLNACTYRHMSDDSTFHLNINTLEKGLVSREYPVFAGDKSNLDFIVQYINSSSSFTKFCTEQKKGGTRTRLYYKTLCEYKMMLPSLTEQDRIASYFSSLDTLITLHQRKCEQTKKLKKYMLQKMFPQGDSKFPEIRFSGFTDAWEQRKLSEIADKAVDNRGKTPTISEDGTHPLLEVASLGNGTPDYTKVTKYLSDETFETELRAYIKEGDILFSTVGSIGLVSLMDTNENAAIAQNIVAFRANEKFDSKFLYAMLSTEDNQYKAQRIVMGAVQPSIKVSQLVDVEYWVTENLSEQRKLGEYFLNLDNLITLHQRKCFELQEIKKYMLKSMFV